MLQTTIPHLPKRPAPRPNPFALLDLPTLMGILRRRKWLIAGCGAAFAGLALLIALTTTPLYTSEAEILIDTRAAAQLDSGTNTANGGNLLTLGMDPGSVDSQVEILKSEHIAELVLRKLKLERDPEFTTPGSLIALAAALVRDWLPLGDSAPDDPNRIPRVVMEEFQDRLDVKRTNATYVLTIAFRARSRERAALIANEIADAYLTDQLRAKYEATRRAGSWLQDRIKELREASLASDRAAQDYKAKNNIISTGAGKLLNEQQVGEMSSQLVAARTATAEAEAKFRRLTAIVAKGDPDAATADILTGPVFNDLQTRSSAAAKRLAEVSQRLGETHPAVVNLRNEIADLRRLTLDELRRAMEGYQSSVEIARAREGAIERSLAQLSGESNDTNQAQVELRELERDAVTSRTLYEGFLERYKTALQQESFPITEARILSMASPPRLKSHPKTVLLLAVGLIGGLTVGAAAALLLELTDGRARTPQQLETAFEAPCIGVLPAIRRGPSRQTRPRPGLEPPPAGAAIPLDVGLLRHAVVEPFSRFAETLRAIRVAADNAAGVDAVKVVSMLSAVPGEGKSLVAANFAQLAAYSGRNVLLIDADLRKPTLSAAFAPGAGAGLVEVLHGEAVLGDVLRIDPVSGLFVLPSVTASTPHSSELLGSEAMRTLLQQAATRFDLVVVDLPPLVPIVDVRAIAPMIDAFVFVAQSGRTRLATAVETLRGAPAIGDRLLGTVLNRANLKSLRRRLPTGDETYDAGPAYRAYVSD